MHIPLTPYISLFVSAYTGELYKVGQKDFRELDLSLISKKLSVGLTNNIQYHKFLNTITK